MMSPETLFFLRNLVSLVELKASSPSFKQDCMGIMRAMDELDAELAKVGQQTPAADIHQ